MKPVIIHYRGKKKLTSVKADFCHGEIPAYSNTFYWIFRLNNQAIVSVPENRIVPKDREKVKMLYGRPWLQKLEALPTIRLREDRDADFSLPKDAHCIWQFEDLADTYVIQCENRTILRVLNNPERIAKGTFFQGLKRLFPGKKIFINELVTRIVQVQ